MTATGERLRRLVKQAPTSPDALWQLLVEGLDWPAPAEMRLGDVEVDWSPEELHLDPEKVSRLTAIRQVPPFTAQQNFGVFVLDFEGGRLPVGAIRRLVERLVKSQRARPGAGSRPTWALDDLLFFCISSAQKQALHVVGFRESGGKRVLRVMSWSEDMTDARLDLLVNRGMPDLQWGDAGPLLAEVDGLRGFHGYREGIRTASALSTRMADVAQDVRDEVAALYEVETADGPIRRLYADVRDQLLGDLTPQRFADVYAQTMVYGLLTARIAHPEEFQADKNITALRFDNPFLDAIYARFRSQSGGVVDVDELGLRELAEELAATDVDNLLADFGAADRRDDPVVYFYEDFLAKYDPQQRRDLGAFYTPIPVVRYIVRSVDECLQRVFGLPGGVADPTTWADYRQARPEVDLPTGCEPTDRVVSMFDPANGTGTFLVEWLRIIREREGSSALGPALQASSALEISLASYAVAHLKVSLELPEDLREAARLPIYLGDTLGLPRPHVLDEMANPVSAEGTLADDVKYERFHNVVIGNPPYDRVESGSTGGWVTAEAEDGRSLFDDILDPAKAHTIFSHHASLYNLYVYFWRWSLWKAFEQNDGPAVISMITASSWLNGPGFLGLRQIARELADEIWVTDLGGENKGARKEDNVFDIESPVAVVTLVRANKADRSQPARVRYLKIRGTRQEKLDALECAAESPPGEWADAPSDWHAPFAPPAGAAEWTTFPALIDLLPWQQPGAMISRTWPVGPTKEVLRRRWRRFLATNDPKDRLLCFAPSKTGRNITTIVNDLPRLVDLPIGAEPLSIVPFGLRSFDRQWTFEDPRLAKTESPSLWSSLSSRQIFMTSMTTGQLGHGPAATAATAVPDKHHFRGSFGGKDVIPLYRDAAGTPNADQALLAVITSRHRAIDETAASVSAEDLFTYCYAVLAGTDYTQRFHAELETPGPRVPLTCDPALFHEVAHLGRQLLHLHTSGERFPDHVPEITSRCAWQAPVTGMPNDLKEVGYDRETWRLTIADGSLEGVRPDVWDFEVSGMQVVRKWLSRRCTKPAGKAASSKSPLDHIRPEEWHRDWSRELVELVETLTTTLDLQPTGVTLLERILDGPLVDASALPEVPAALRKPPSAKGKAEQTFEDLED